MKAIIKNNPNTTTGIIAALVIAAGITLFLCSLSANQLSLLLNY